MLRYNAKRFFERFAAGFVLLFCLEAFSAEIPKNPKKVPVPDDAAQERARQLIADVYGKEISAADTAERARTLAQKMLKTAAESKDSPASQYALLREAGNLALKAGDVPTAIEAADRLDGLFLIDATSMKLAVIGSAAKRIATPAAGKALADIALEVAQDAAEIDDYDAARRAAALATTAAGRTRDAAIVRAVKEHKKRLEEMAAAYNKVQTAIAALEKNPADPQANLAVGRYRILQGNWEEALRLLVLGSDKGLADIARADATGAKGAEEQVKLGNAWWYQAEREEKRYKVPIRRRAVYWYEQALPGLTGLTRAEVEKRIAEVKAAEEGNLEGTARLRRGTKIYLDDLKEAEANILVGTLGKHNEPGARGERMWFRGVCPAHILSTHPPRGGSSTVTYDLNGQYRAFFAIAGLRAASRDWTGQANSPVTFRVWCDGKLVWQSRPLQKHNDGQACMVPLRHVKRLKLEAYCDGENPGAWAAWIEPYVVK